jgi:cytochrome c oxidase subunit 1
MGAYMSFASSLLFVVIVLVTFARKQRVGDNPWGEGATTLEWTVSSPPPFHTFEVLPQVK